MVTYDKGFGARLFDKLNIFFLILVVVATLYPFYYVTIVSLSDGKAVLRGEVNLFPIGTNLGTYKLVFRTNSVTYALANSVLYTTVGTLINLVMTALCAYPLSRPRFSGRTFYIWVVTLTMFFSGGLIPLYLLILQLGLRNSIWALVLPVAISPWNMFMMRTYFQGLPEEIFDAAKIDGADELQTMLRVVLPLAKPIFATLLLFYAVAHWNRWLHPLIFLDDKVKFPIQLILRSVVLVGRMEYSGEFVRPSEEMMVIERGLKYATIMVSTIPILVVYPFVQKYFVKGVMIGAIKG